MPKCWDTHGHKHTCTFVDDRLLNEIQIKGALKVPSFGGPPGQRYTNFTLMCAPPPPSTVRGFILSSLTSGPSGCETTAACRQTSLAARLFNHSRAVVMCAECGLALSCLKKKSSHFAEMLLPNLFYRSALMAPSQMCRLPRMPCRSKPLHIIQSAGFRRDRFGGS